MKTTTKAKTADTEALPKRNATSGRFEKAADTATPATKTAAAKAKPAAKAVKPAAAKAKKA